MADNTTYRRAGEYKILRVKHLVTFTEQTTAGYLKDALANVPDHATVDEVFGVQDHVDGKMSIQFHEESPLYDG